MENWKELLASFGLWLLVEDISDDGDGKGDNLQLTKDGELFVSEIQQELDRAREEGARDVFTKDEWFMLKLAMNDIFNGGNRAYEDISNKIKSQLSKLNKKK